MSVEHILELIRTGDLTHRVDEGFLFVDAAPTVTGTAGHPPTFTVLSDAELHALQVGDEDADGRNEPDTAPEIEASEDVECADRESDGDDEESQSSDDDEASVELGDWRAARHHVGKTRIPPGRNAVPQAA